MIPVPTPFNEEQRLQELYNYCILDSEPEQDFSDLVDLASYICGTPISTITLVDRNRQWFKAKKGLPDQETERGIAFCGYTVMGTKPFIVEDARKDERFADFPNVLGEPNIAFYAGFPLVTPNGNSIGSLCVIDNIPRVLNEQQEKALDTLAHHVMKMIAERSNALRHKERARLEKKQNTELEKLMQTQRRILTILGHDARAPLYAINQMLKITAKQRVSGDELKSNIELITNQLGATLIMIEDLLSWGKGHLKPNETELQKHPVTDTVEDVMNVFRSNAQLKGLQLNNTVNKSLRSPVPLTMLSFIIRNLLNNAIKFTDNGSITINAAAEHAHLVITVTDTGKGMSPAQVNQLNCGVQPDHDHGQFYDSGIGVMMIQEFLLQLGGTIHFESKQGQGTKVSVRLPQHSPVLQGAGENEHKFVL